MTFRNWNISLLILSVMMITTVFTQGIDEIGCLEYSAGICIRCSEETHFYQNNCYKNILGCKKYEEGFKCIQCDESISYLTGNTCTLLPGQGPSLQFAANLYKYGNPGDRYGGTNYIPISYEKVIREQNTFKIMDIFLKTGQWGHFISKSENPVYSVHYRIRNDTDRTGRTYQSYGYKTLYQGTGGGLFLCIAQVPTNNYAVKIQSLTVIQLAQLVDHCIDYQVASAAVCIRCQKGYNLQNGQCFVTYGACIKYIENICLECKDYYLLVENRCVSDCVSVSDARSILFYQNSNTSTLNIAYPGSSNNLSSYFTTTTKVITTTVTTVNRVQNRDGAIIVIPISQNQQTTQKFQSFNSSSS